MKTIIFIAGTKGGVGKSTLAQYLYSAATELAIDVNLYDSDSENKTLVSLIDSVVFLDDTNDSYPLDKVINDALDSQDDFLSIVDMKAGTSRSTQDWFKEVPWDLLKISDINIYIAGCVTSDPDSSRTLGTWLDYFSIMEQVKFLVIKNEKDGTDFSAFENGLETIFLGANYPILTFKAMDKTYQSDLNNNRFLLKDVVNGTKSVPGRAGKMTQSRYKSYYDSYINSLKDFLNEIND